MSPSRVRTAANAGVSPPVPGARSFAEANKRSGGREAFAVAMLLSPPPS